MSVDLPGRVQAWESLSIAEQTLIRGALSGAPLAGMIQTYGAALRWAGMPEAPRRSYTADEQRRLIPYLAGVAEELAGRGLLDVPLLADPATWIWDADAASGYRLRAAPHLRGLYAADAYPVADPDGLPSWEQLSTEQREVLVCAAENSGYLTGAFGIWPDPPAGLTSGERQAWIERQCAPLVPFVGSGWIEVRHFPDSDTGAYTVIPLDALNRALADPAIRDGEEWGVGVGCVFTYEGLAVWRGAWAREWNSRLHFD